MSAVPMAKFRFAEHAQVDDGRVGRQLPDHERHEPGRRDERAPPHPRRREPVHLLPLVQHHLQRPRNSDHAAESQVVDAALAAGLMYGGSSMKAWTISMATSAHRQVDVEDPAPRVVVGDPAAQRRAEDGRDDHAHRERGHRRRRGAPAGSSPSAWPGPSAGARRRPLPGGSARPPASPRLVAAPHSADARVNTTMHVTRNRLRPNRLPSHAVIGKTIAFDDEVAREDPGRLLRRGRQAAGDVRQGDVRDRGIEDFHERGQHHRDGDQPRVEAGRPLGRAGGRRRRLRSLVVARFPLPYESHYNT